MRLGDFVEKRRFKRLDMSLPIEIRRVLRDEKQEIQDGITINLSFNGAYVAEIKDIDLEERINISLSVSRDYIREFPLSRIAGKAKVVRVENDSIALEFAENITRLFVAV